MPGTPGIRFARHQVIEVVGVVQPELGPIFAIPVVSGGQLSLHTKELKHFRSSHGCDTGATHPCTNRIAQARCRAKVRSWPIKTEPQAAVNLLRLQPTDRVPETKKALVGHVNQPPNWHRTNAQACRLAFCGSAPSLEAAPEQVLHQEYTFSSNRHALPGTY